MAGTGTLSASRALARSGRAPAWAVTAWRFARTRPLGALGGLIVLGLVGMALGADCHAHDPQDDDASEGPPRPGASKPPRGPRPRRSAPYTYDDTAARMHAPSRQFWMGTDNLGRDIWSRVVYGARISVTVGFATVALATLLAAAIGISSAYLGGAYDIAVQRLVDAWQSFPGLVIILSLMAVLGPGLLNLILALSILGAAGASRVIRGATLSVMQHPYIEAARAMGAGHLRIVLSHIVPNVLATIIVLATIGLGTVILVESALSFLGFGVPPPYPSWGGMVSGLSLIHI